MSCNEVRKGNECYLLALHLADLLFKLEGPCFPNVHFKSVFRNASAYPVMRFEVSCLTWSIIHHRCYEMHEIGFSERKYARRRGGVLNFLLSHFSFQSILSRKPYEQFLSNLGFAETRKKSFTDISDFLGKDVLMSYFLFMSVSSSHIAVWGSIPESFLLF